MLISENLGDKLVSADLRSDGSLSQGWGSSVKPPFLRAEEAVVMAVMVVSTSQCLFCPPQSLPVFGDLFSAVSHVLRVMLQ